MANPLYDASYRVGTATPVAGSHVVTFQNAGALAQAVNQGDYFYADGGVPLAIESVDSPTQVTLYFPWRGTTTGPVAYEVRKQFGALLSIPERQRQLVEKLEQGVLTDLAEAGPIISSLMGFDASGAFVQRSGEETLDFIGAQPAGDYQPAGNYQPAGDYLTPQSPISASQIPSNLTANKAYRNGNILGTVSHSNGVPTGAMIERGFNANGEYVRFANGTQIFAGRFESATNMTFAAQFTGGPPYLVASVNTADVEAPRYCTVQLVNSTVYRVRTYISETVTSSTPGHVLAIGRWF